MVTAILIPIICFYFYWVTKKDLKENEEKWINLTRLKEEALVSGQIIQINKTKKRFYYHRYVEVVQIKLQTETRIIQVKRVIPFTNETDKFNLGIGDRVRLYGNWGEDEFRFLRYEILN
jgi:hypothetical protein